MALILLLLALIAIFVAIALVVLSVGTAVLNRKDVVRSLSAIEEMQISNEKRQLDLNSPFTDRVITPTLEKFTEWGKQFAPADQANRIRRRLDLAGNPPTWDPNRIVAFKVLGLIGGLILGLLLGLLFGSGLIAIIGLMIISSLAGYFGPNLALYQVGYNRTQQMAKDSAVSQVARNTTGPLAEEFFRLLQEMQIGLSRTEAIRAMGERSDIPELRNFASAMVQADRLGIPVANVLRVQAGEMRTKRSQRAEEMAQKVPVKILFPLVFCILPVLFIMILGPAAISIIGSFAGK